MKSDPSNPLCYSCKFRGTVPGSAHSMCNISPDTSMVDSLLVGMTGTDGVTVKGNPHGVKNGWFMWPVDFDPVWLENCEGYENKDDIRKT